jgi:hypothetical protein
MSLTKLKIKKRLIYIKAIRKVLEQMSGTFTHKTSKRRDLIKNIVELVNLLEREIRRDIKTNVN